MSTTTSGQLQGFNHGRFPLPLARSRGFGAFHSYVINTQPLPPYNIIPNSMAAATFPHFPQLPTELQIQIWQEATLATIPIYHLNQSQFGVQYSFTYFSIPTVVLGRLTSQGRVTKAHIPRFSNIMGACRIPRLIALEWWRRLLAECWEFADYGHYEARTRRAKREKVGVVEDLDELIEDMRSRFEGEETRIRRASNVVNITDGGVNAMVGSREW